MGKTYSYVTAIFKSGMFRSARQNEVAFSNYIPLRAGAYRRGSKNILPYGRDGAHVLYAPIHPRNERA